MTSASKGSTAGIGAQDASVQDFTGRDWVLDSIDEWIGTDTGQLLIISGPAGSGKSTLVEYLSAISDGRLSPRSTFISKDRLSYVHVCHAQDDLTVDPLRFVERLSTRLQHFVPGFVESLKDLSRPDISVVGTATADHADSGATVAGVIIKSLHVPNQSARRLFDRVVRRPLEGLSGELRPIVVIDGLDEALTYDDGENLVDLIALVGQSASQSAGLRLLVTTRGDERVLMRFSQTPLDLVVDAPPKSHDVQDYVEQRLHNFPSTKADVAKDVARAASGSFLYARYVVDALMSEPSKLADPERIVLPSGLEGHYREYIARELTRRGERWQEYYRPVLGLLCVARGKGLTRDHLVGATDLPRSRIDDALHTLSQYLMPPGPSEPYRLFHESFREFLMSNPDFPIYPAEAHASLGQLLYDRHSAKWSECDDDYALMHAIEHLSRAANAGTVLDARTLTKVRASHAAISADNSYGIMRQLAFDYPEVADLWVAQARILSQIDAWFDSGATPILVVTGGPAAGKTFLTQIIHRTRANHGDSWFPSLSSGLTSTVVRGYSLTEHSACEQFRDFLLAAQGLPPNERDYHKLPARVRWSLIHELSMRLPDERTAPTPLIILDALDEATESYELAESIVRIVRDSTLRVIVTSRPGTFLAPFTAKIARFLEMDPLPGLVNRLSPEPANRLFGLIRSLDVPESVVRQIVDLANGNRLTTKSFVEVVGSSGVLPE